MRKQLTEPTFLSLTRCSLGSWFSLAMAHSRHHLLTAFPPCHAHDVITCPPADPSGKDAWYPSLEHAWRHPEQQ